MKTDKTNHESYRDLARRLLPPGGFWAAVSAPGRIFTAILEGIGMIFARIHNHLIDAVNETDPRAATQTLTAWERMTGVKPAATIAARQQNIHTQWTANGGINPDEYAKMAARIGANINVETPYNATRVQDSFADDYAEPIASEFIWSIIGTVYADQVDPVMELLNKHKPGHIALENNLTIQSGSYY